VWLFGRKIKVLCARGLAYVRFVCDAKRRCSYSLRFVELYISDGPVPSLRFTAVCCAGSRFGGEHLTLSVVVGVHADGVERTQCCASNGVSGHCLGVCSGNVTTIPEDPSSCRAHLHSVASCYGISHTPSVSTFGEFFFSTICF